MYTEIKSDILHLMDLDPVLKTSQKMYVTNDNIIRDVGRMLQEEIDKEVLTKMIDAYNQKEALEVIGEEIGGLLEL
jgi:phosphopantothenate synthetase